MGHRLLACVSFLAATACAHYPHTPALTAPLPPESRYAFDTLEPGADNTDSLFVCAAFSGAGTRAAALAYGLLMKLKATPIVWEGRSKTLLSELDFISAVSGGSFTAAYYGLFGDKIFNDFRKDFLDRDVEGDIAERVWVLHNLVRLASPTFSRIDIAAEVYSDLVFHERTYGDLLRAKKRPFVLIDATDVETGHRFEFTQEQFDRMGDDLSRFPVARAVAASSAFPYLRGPLTLESHAGPHDVRLQNGAFSDDDGLRAVWSAFQRPDGFLAHLRGGRIHTLLLFVVKEKGGMGLEQWKNARQLLGLPEDMQLFVVDIGLDQLQDDSKRERLLKLPTNLVLTKAQVKDVIDAADELVEQHAEFQRFLRTAGHGGAP